MRTKTIRLLTCALAAVTLPLSACGGKNNEMLDMPPSMNQQRVASSSTSVVSGAYGPRAIYNGKETYSIQGELQTSVAVSDGKNGVVIIPGEPHKKQNSQYVDARELKLKVRELADQLISDMRDCSLQGTVALPVAFVNLDNFEQSSSFGRYMSEQLMYEFNQRGFPVREYRIPNTIRVTPEKGELYLSREIGKVAANTPGAVVIAGTYYADKATVLVNARIIRPKDGRVLRTASLVLNANPLTKRMLAGGHGKTLKTGQMNTRDYTEATKPFDGTETPFDRGEDIH